MQMEVTRYSRHQALQVSRQQLLQTLHHMDSVVSKINLAQEFALGKLIPRMQPQICCGINGPAGQPVVMTAKSVIREATTTDTASQKCKSICVVCSADLQLVS